MAKLMAKTIQKLFVVDSSALLSGKPIAISGKLVVPNGVEKEINKGGRDFRQFRYMLEAGMQVRFPSQDSMEKVEIASHRTGDDTRISDADREVLALALELRIDGEDAVILSDDYSIQNVAEELCIPYQSFEHRGIKEKFKWIYKCKGCGRNFDKKYKLCPFCGSELKQVRDKRSTCKNGDNKKV
jgi:UPF0271 protein